MKRNKSDGKKSHLTRSQKILLVMSLCASPLLIWLVVQWVVLNSIFNALPAPVIILIIVGNIISISSLILVPMLEKYFRQKNSMDKDNEQPDNKS